MDVVEYLVEKCAANVEQPGKESISFLGTFLLAFTAGIQLRTYLNISLCTVCAEVQCLYSVDFVRLHLL